MFRYPKLLLLKLYHDPSFELSERLTLLDIPASAYEKNLSSFVNAKARRMTF
jgi:hypothetical protein